jgi:hypothetical protein
MKPPHPHSLRQRLAQALPDYPDRDKVLTQDVLAGDMTELLGALRAQYAEVEATRSKPKFLAVPMVEVIDTSKKKKELHRLLCHVEDLDTLLSFLRKDEGIDHPQLNSIILQVVNTGDYEPLRDLVKGRAEGIRGRADHALESKADMQLSMREYLARSKQASQLMKAWFDSASLAADLRAPS